MSRLIGLLALLAAGTLGCESSHTCSLIACLDGVVVSFTGLSAHTSYDIAIAQVTPASDALPIVSCTISTAANGSRQLACMSSEVLNEFGTSVQIQDNTLQAIEITVSSDGAQVAQQTFDLTYQSTEINGVGCGVCTSANITMAVQ